MHIKLEKIHTFWNWFSENEIYLRPDVIITEVINDLEVELQKIDIQAWEIGPSSDKNVRQFFAMPLMRELAYDEHVKTIIKHAVNLKDWSFLAGLPRKSWPRKILWGPSGKVLDVSNWKFQIEQNNNKLYYLKLISDKKNVKTRNDISGLVYKVLENELGQILMDELIYSIEVEVVPNIAEVRDLVSLPVLHEILMNNIQGKV